jgi:hypothetical protein
MPLTRRSVLLGLGACTSLGVARAAVRAPPEELAVKLWLTQGAASRPSSGARAAGYIERALSEAGVGVTVTVAESAVDVSAVDDRRLERVTWPRLVAQGVANVGGIDPVSDVNLLLTDRAVTGRTAGYAVPNIATVPGASHLAGVAPADESPPVVEFSVPVAVTQLLLHEVGHALGLKHQHGTSTVDGPVATVSPMVAGYAWRRDGPDGSRSAGGENVCGEAIDRVTDERRRLSLRYADCAATAIRRYRGGLLP